MCCYAFLLASVDSKAKLAYEKRFALAQAHNARMLSKVMCGVPQTRVMKLETAHLRVMPPATLIHRCGDSTGCCDFYTERCMAKSKELVTVYAFVRPRFGTFKRKHGRNRIKKFVFMNHTECYCRNTVDTPK
ncbi:hypothetical protein AVEN_150075-1 [Araneus ventricosus]|uniref:Platelet-derived growth factor (PDGF) family profile domain-containing protein n=1 Tax=Araneus ventricosus TaxID=182803 RepID=A0A4Y2ES72_ARAVE|nr:hypothetical protein AVEN_150075-1 [Araneus ventricosus]